MHCELCGRDFKPIELETTETNVVTGERRSYFETFCAECHADDPEASSTVCGDDDDEEETPPWDDPNLGD